MKAILFDMDGTLLPMEQEDFTRLYFHGILSYCAPLGLAPDRMKEMLWASIQAMVKNDGTVTNAVRFEEVFTTYFPGKEAELQQIAGFYTSTYDRIGEQVTPRPLTAAIIRLLKQKGYRLVVATNPFFPEEAQRRRLRWAGLEPTDFEWITHFDNSHYCKPNPAYYTEILEVCRLQPSDCVMVGNDVEEDMEAAKAAGIEGWLLTDHLLNRQERSLDDYVHGDLSALYAWASALPAAE